ncbi:MAG: HAD family hydrolase [Bacteroidota bacterium]
MHTIHCKAIIFDLDGILVNSNPIAERHWKIWADAKGVSLDHILAIHHGRPTALTIREVAPHLDADAEAARKEKVEADDIDGLSRYAGTYQLLSQLPGGQWAIATSGTRRTATKRLGVVGLPAPEVFITADDVINGKPAPDPYRQAIEGLGFAPDECVVIEDAPAGIKSAKTAGARVIAVTSTNKRPALAEADYIVPAFDQIAVIIGDILEIKLDVR